MRLGTLMSSMFRKIRSNVPYRIKEMKKHVDGALNAFKLVKWELSPSTIQYQHDLVVCCRDLVSIPFLPFLTFVICRDDHPGNIGVGRTLMPEARLGPKL